MTVVSKDLKVLIVDENAATRSMVANAIRSIGIGSVFSAETADHALKLFAQEKPDIVFASWELKPSNGLQFTKLLRSPQSLKHDVHIVLMVVLTSIQQVADARDAGVTEFLCRPFSANQVTLRLSHVVNNPREFITTKDFRGPCRRRTKSSNFSGPFRRKDDSKP